MKVFVVIGRCSKIPAGYGLIGVRETEEEAEALKKAREEKSGMLENRLPWDHIDVWGDCDTKEPE